MLARAFAFAFAALVAVGFAIHPARRSSSAGRMTSLVDDSLPSVGAVLDGEHGTYIGLFLRQRDSSLNRWPDRTDNPIRVWIEPTSQRGFSAIVQTAFGDWTGSGIPIRFVFVDAARDAEIHVRWADRLSKRTGNTIWRADDHGWLEGGDIVLARHLSGGHSLDGRSLRAIALHEIGHALGMAHSDDPHDVMAPLVRVSALSPADRATARLLYAMPAGHLR
jgi:hypothetical protein